MTAGAGAVRVEGLRKSYDGVEALRGVDLRVAHGEIFAFLGPNGAGKTTVVEILAGFRARTAGDVVVLGVDPQHGTRAWRDRIGIVLQESAPDPGLTVRESLALYAGYFARPLAVDAVLSLIALQPQAGEIATTLSGGQRRRLDLGLALIGDPDLIFLDEPTTGFDPAARRAAWDVVLGLRALGKTILLTTHDMEEAEVLADRIAVIVDGSIVAEGRPGTLGGRDRSATRVAFATPPHAAAAAAAELGRILSTTIATGPHGGLSLSPSTPLADLERLARWSRDSATPISDLQVSRASLEQIYLQLTDPRREREAA